MSEITLSDHGDEKVDSSQLSPSVKEFVRNHLRVTDNPNQMVELQEMWELFDSQYGGVAREYFKWHLVHSLPESVDRDLDEFYGIEVVNDESYEIRG